VESFLGFQSRRIFPVMTEAGDKETVLESTFEEVATSFCVQSSGVEIFEPISIRDDNDYHEHF
jgi:hypothetical protein